MSLYDDASLIMYPSGYKEDKLYSLKPTNGDGDFTFTRASSATRVNSEGLIEEVPYNLLEQSNTFDTTWSTTRATLTSGESGYDGSSNAWAMIDNTVNSTHLLVQTFTIIEGKSTFSVYAKAGAVDFIVFRFEGATVDYAYFNLSNGTIGTVDANYTNVSITDAGNGWYKCEATNESVNKAVILTAQSDNDPTYAGAGTTAIYIQDAQVVKGSTAKPYFPTTDRLNVPRIDYTGGCGSLLLEGQTTNLITYSEDFSQSGWTKSNATVTLSNELSPMGILNSYDVVFTSGGYLLESVSTTKTIGSRETISIFSKSDIAGIFLKFGGGTASGTDVQKKENYGSGWFRYSVTRTFTEAETGNTQLIVSSDEVGLNVVLFGAQLEQGYPTSYIPTAGATATRTADLMYTEPNALGGGSVGTLMVEIERIAIDTSNTGAGVQLLTSSNNEEIRLHFDAPLSQVRWRDANNGYAQIGAVLSVTTGEFFKMCVVSDGTTAKAFGNGSQLGSNYSIVTPFSFDRLSLPQKAYKVKQIYFSNQALTDAECITLTTL